MHFKPPEASRVLRYCTERLSSSFSTSATHIIKIQPPIPRFVAMEIQADPGVGAGPVNRSSNPRFRRDKQSFKWSRVILASESILPPPRSGAASVVVKGKLYMFGVS